MALLKACPICGKLFPYGKTYCDKCAPAAEVRKAERLRQCSQKANKQYDEKRKGTREYKFYRSKEWRTLSAAVMQQRRYKCERCGAYGQQVHHKIEIKTDEGWKRRFDDKNLELLCIKCHNRAHKRF